MAFGTGESGAEDFVEESTTTVDPDQLAFSYYGGLLHVLGIDGLEAADLPMLDDSDGRADNEQIGSTIERLIEERDLAGLELYTYRLQDGSRMHYFVINLEAADTKFGLELEIAYLTLVELDRLRSNSEVRHGFAADIDARLEALLEILSDSADGDIDTTMSFFPDGTSVGADWPEFDTLTHDNSA